MPGWFMDIVFHSPDPPAADGSRRIMGGCNIRLIYTNDPNSGGWHYETRLPPRAYPPGPCGDYRASRSPNGSEVKLNLMGFYGDMLASLNLGPNGSRDFPRLLRNQSGLGIWQRGDVSAPSFIPCYWCVTALLLTNEYW